MNYEDLKAPELRKLCEEHGIRPSRAKADMVADLKALDSANELTRLSQELGLPDEPMPVSEPAPAPEVQPEPESAPEEPVWLSEGRLYKRVKRHGVLDDREHHRNLRDVIEEAEARGLEHFGPSFRVNDPDTHTWVYAINLR